MGFGMKDYSIDNRDGHPLRNSLLILLGISLLLVALIIFFREFVLVDGSSLNAYSKKNWKQINVEANNLTLISQNGTIYNSIVSDDMIYDMDGPGWRQDIIINQPGEFTIYSDITWDKDTLSSSLLTGYIIMSESGNVKYAWYGPDLHTEKKISLDEGSYILQRCYIGNDNDLKNFCNKCNLPYQNVQYQFPTDTKWKLTDSYGIRIN